MIAGAVDIIVHIDRDKTGQRKIQHIVETAGSDISSTGVTHGVKLNTLWKYDRNNGWQWVAEEFRRKEKLIEDGGWKCSF